MSRVVFTKRHEPPRLPDGRYDIYFSYWSWKILKTCPYQYRLLVLEHLRPAIVEKGNAIQGGVPDKMVEDFFAKPVDVRKQLTLQWFYDHFEEYWTQFQTDPRGKITWMTPAEEQVHVAALAAEKPIPQQLRRKFNRTLKKKETYDHISNLLDMLASRNLIELRMETQHTFKAKIEETSQYVLTLGGRIDLLFEVAEGVVDIWDLKGVKREDYNDDDQLGVYKMGILAGGRKVRHCGFLNMKQKHFDDHKIDDAFLRELRLRMIDVFMSTIARGNYTARFDQRTCEYCDVNGSCNTYLENRETTFDVKQLLGKNKILL
jgi:hypothetical protein